MIRGIVFFIWVGFIRVGFSSGWRGKSDVLLCVNSRIFPMLLPDFFLAVHRFFFPAAFERVYFAPSAVFTSV
jgi:hypothetical protein